MIDNQCPSSSHVSWRLPCMSFNGPRARVFASCEMDVCLEFSESCRLSRRLLVDVLTNLLAIHETKPWPYQHSQLNRRTGVYRWLLNLAHVSGNLVHFSFNNNLPTQKGWTPCFRFFIMVKDCQVCYRISMDFNHISKKLPCAQGGLRSLSTTISLISESSSVLMTWSFSVALVGQAHEQWLFQLSQWLQPQRIRDLG